MATRLESISSLAAEPLAIYCRLVDRLHEGDAGLSHAEAMAALETASAIIENSLKPVPELAQADLLALTQRVSGLKPGESQAKRRWVYREGAPVSHSVSLLGGVNALLTAEYKLVALELDPEDAKRVERAFRFVGIASDAPDVAENHDNYL